MKRWILPAVALLWLVTQIPWFWLFALGVLLAVVGVLVVLEIV